MQTREVVATRRATFDSQEPRTHRANAKVGVFQGRICRVFFSMGQLETVPIQCRERESGSRVDEVISTWFASKLGQSDIH